MTEEIDLQGKCAIVTGGTRGIGRAIVEALGEREMRVLATGREQGRLDQLSRDLGDRMDLETLVCDNGDPDQIAALFKHARELFPKLFLLVNNAAVGLYGACDDVVVEEWDLVMDVNARGYFLCSREAYRWMKEGGGGRIVNIASVVGHKGYPDQLSYAASKHAVMGITKVMAREGQEYGIRVSAICPGGVATDLVKQARPDLDAAELIQPADVGRAVLYLASEPQTCCTDLICLRRANSTPFA